MTTYNFTVQASDLTLDTTNSAQSVKVQLGVDGDIPNTVGVNQPYAHSVVAGGGTPPYNWRIQDPPGEPSNVLPPGVTIDPDSGVIHGTPTQTGTYTPLIIVQDSAAPPATASISQTITVFRVQLTGDAPDAPLARSYAYAEYAASGGTGPYTFTVVSGSLPTGLTMSASGQITGTPTATGVYTFSVVATDSGGNQSLPLEDIIDVQALGYTQVALFDYTNNQAFITDDFDSWESTTRTNEDSGSNNLKHWARVGDKVFYYTFQSNRLPIEICDNPISRPITTSLQNLAFAPVGGVGYIGRNLYGGRAWQYQFGRYDNTTRLYATSEDGITWETTNVNDLNLPFTPLATNPTLSCVHKMPSGRWIMIVYDLWDGSPWQYYYSDDPGHPVNWTPTTSPSGSTPYGGALYGILSDQNRTFYKSGSDIIWTEDGINWNREVGGSAAITAVNLEVEYYATNNSGVWVTFTAGSSPTQEYVDIFRSADSGLTWSFAQRINVPRTQTAGSILYHNGIFAICFRQSATPETHRLYVSYDDGVSWTEKAVPTTGFVSLVPIIVPPSIIQPSISGDAPDAARDAAYSESPYILSGGVPPYNISLVSGSLPTGLSMSSNGVITGTPTLAGTSSFVVKATDARGIESTHLSDSIRIYAV